MLKQIYQLRVQSKLSQAALAKEIGVSQKSIDNWESGLSQPSIAYVVRLADFFECSVDYLLGREDDYGNIALSSERGESERALLNFFAKCDAKSKASVISYAEFLSQKS